MRLIFVKIYRQQWRFSQQLFLSASNNLVHIQPAVHLASDGMDIYVGDLYLLTRKVRISASTVCFLINCSSLPTNVDTRFSYLHSGDAILFLSSGGGVSISSRSIQLRNPIRRHTCKLEDTLLFAPILSSLAVTRGSFRYCSLKRNT